MIQQEQAATAAISLLQQLVRIPSFSKEEAGTAALLQKWLLGEGVITERHGNNIIARNRHFKKQKPTLLLNSHHDTVKPAAGYTRDPFTPDIEDGKLYGLGSNDAGGCVAALAATFLHFYPQENLPYNIVLAITAEEEISGANGISSILPSLGKIDCAIVGEPTLMQMAVAERGLLVVDGIATGRAGHAARNEGENAIYKAMKDVEWFRTYKFEKTSEWLGPVSMNVTVVDTANRTHNVIPDSCRYTVDIRINECYTHEEILETIKANVASNISARSTRLRSSIIAAEHPLVAAGTTLGLQSYGSPTLSDKALLPVAALKIGPGDSARSHTADEFIYTAEIEEGINTYIKLISAFFNAASN
ncbi:M20 family metallo-hydrolase [Chitinophagaceae bacterium MMS25-I14]